MTGPQITLARKSGAAALQARVKSIGRLAAYVGIPATSANERRQQLLKMAGKATGKKKKRLEKAAETDINNAELLYVFEKGSPKRHQPPRPLLNPAIEADDNKKKISFQLNASTKASLAGDQETARKRMKAAALAGENAARLWFVDPRNKWQPNAPSVAAAKRRKGSTEPVPGIDTGAMRAAIQGITREE